LGLGLKRGFGVLRTECILSPLGIADLVAKVSAAWRGRGVWLWGSCCMVCLSVAVSDVLGREGAGYRIPSETRQLIVGVSAGWDSSQASVRLYERREAGWKVVGEPFATRLGKAGLAWGRGVHPMLAGLQKKENDARAPAGIFRLGKAYGYASDVSRHPNQPYVRVTSRDLWVSDPASPHYNKHLRLQHDGELSGWEKQQQMKQGDPAHSLKLFIAHNAAPDAIPTAGSAIFFHIWRADGGKPSAGCTVMAQENLRRLIAWVDPSLQPLFVLLPKPVYDHLRGAWGLP